MVTTHKIAAELLKGRKVLGHAMDYHRLDGAWISERKTYALICKAREVAAKDRPKGATKKASGWELRVTEDNLAQGKKFLDAISKSAPPVAKKATAKKSNVAKLPVKNEMEKLADNVGQARSHTGTRGEKIA